MKNRHYMFFGKYGNRSMILLIGMLLLVIRPLQSTESTLEKGKLLVRIGLYAEAETVLRAVLKKDPRNAEAHYFLGCALGYSNSRCIENPTPDWTWVEGVSKEFEQVLSLQRPYTGEILRQKPEEKILSCWSFLALSYLCWNSIERARDALSEIKKRGGFNSFYREFYYNMLQSCPKNAILITDGDLDTFYSLYLQIMENVRTDVTVVNVWLLYNPWFLHYICRYHPWQEIPVKLSYKNDELNRMDGIAKAMRMPLTFKVPQRHPKKSTDSVAIGLSINLEKTIQFSMDPMNLVLWDMIKANPDRPFCVTITFPLDFSFDKLTLNDKPWNPCDNFELNGLVRTLFLYKNPDDALVSLNQDLAVKRFSYASVPNSALINGYAKFVDHYINPFLFCATILESQGKKEASRALIKRLVERIPGIEFLNDKTRRDYILGIAGTSLSP